MISCCTHCTAAVAVCSNLCCVSISGLEVTGVQLLPGRGSCQRRTCLSPLSPQCLPLMPTPPACLQLLTRPEERAALVNVRLDPARMDCLLDFLYRWAPPLPSCFLCVVILRLARDFEAPACWLLALALGLMAAHSKHKVLLLPLLLQGAPPGEPAAHDPADAPQRHQPAPQGVQLR